MLLPEIFREEASGLRHMCYVSSEERRKSPRPQVMYHPEEGQRIEGCFVLFVKDFIFGFTCYPISGMVSGEVEVYVEENEIL